MGRVQGRALPRHRPHRPAEGAPGTGVDLQRLPPDLPGAVVVDRLLLAHLRARHPGRQRLLRQGGDQPGHVPPGPAARVLQRGLRRRQLRRDGPRDLHPDLRGRRGRRAPRRRVVPVADRRPGADVPAGRHGQRLRRQPGRCAIPVPAGVARRDRHRERRQRHPGWRPGPVRRYRLPARPEHPDGEPGVPAHLRPVLGPGRGGVRPRPGRPERLPDGRPRDRPGQPGVLGRRTSRPATS